MSVNVRRLAGAALPAVVLSGLALWFIPSSGWFNPVRLQVRVRAESGATVRVAVDGTLMDRDVPAVPNPTWVDFPLPRRSIRELRIALPTRSHPAAEIVGIRTRAFLRSSSFAWPAESSDRNKVLASVVSRIDELQDDKILLGLAAALLSIALFLALDSSSLRGAKFLFKPAALSNFVAVFLVAVALPVGMSVFLPGRGSSLPETAGSLPEAFRRDGRSPTSAGLGAFLVHRFPFREAMVRGRNRLMAGFFGVSAVPEVIIGRDGWLFQARTSGELGQADSFLALRPFTEGELRVWLKSLKERKDWLDRRGIAYLLVLAPDKITVYPEYLPRAWRNRADSSRLDQLTQALKERTDVPFLDLRETLMAAKSEQVLFLKTDSHWNDVGAHLASRAVVGRVVSEAGLKVGSGAIPEIEVASRKQKNAPGGNLAMMLTLADSLFREDLVRLRPRFPRSGKAGLPEATTAETVKAEATECRDAFLPRAVMFHDSFGDRLKPFLSECFDRIVYLRDWGFSFNIRVIRAESPSVVIDELSEYFLYNAALNNAQLGGREAEDMPPTGKEGGGE